MNPTIRLARTAGLLYLVVGISSGFAFAFVTAKIYVSGDAATTTANVLANSELVRIGVVADLFQATVFVFLGMTFYLLLKHVSQNVAGAMVVFVAIAAGLMCLNDVFQFAALRVATDGGYVTALGTAGSNALVLLLLDVHHYGFLVAQIFFGLWLVPLGYLAYKSEMFPKALGVLLILGGACYLADMLALFLAPDFGDMINAFVVIPSTVGEVSTVGYLLVKGVKAPKVLERILAPA